MPFAAPIRLARFPRYFRYLPLTGGKGR